MEVDLQIENELKDNLVILTTKEKTKNIQDIVSYIKTRRYFVDGLVNDQKLFIPVDHFINFYSSQKKIFGCTNQSELVINYRLYELEKSLPENFIRISNTEIINLDVVKELQLTANGLTTVIFQNGKITTSSRRYLKKIKERLS